MTHLLLAATPSMTEALGWSLLNFVWQGAVVAALLGLILLLLRPKSAHVRYILLCGAMGMMALCPIVTFTRLLSTNRPVALAAEPLAATPSPLQAPVGITAPVEKTVPAPETDEVPEIIAATPPATSTPRPAIDRHWSISIGRKIEPILPWLVGAWLIGVLTLSVRLLAAWRTILRVTRIGTMPTSAVWRESLTRLAAKLRVSRPVRLVESALVEVPTVVGWLRPIVLLPASALVSLTPSQMEAILAHELAHIRRHDFLVNLIQAAIETVLFYHPAIWWVSRRIREEREHCCDDIAVEICGDRMTYVRALATMEELRSLPLMAVAADGGSLLGRIRRLLGRPKAGDEIASGNAAFSGLAVLASAAACLALVWIASQVHEAHAVEENGDTVLVVQWSAVLDETLLQEIHKIDTTPDPASEFSTETIRCSADALHAIIKPHLGKPKAALLKPVADVVSRTPVEFKPTGIAWSTGHSEIIRDGNDLSNVGWGVSGFVFLDENERGADLRLDLAGSFTAVGSAGCTVKFHETVSDGDAVAFITKAKGDGVWNPALVMVYEALRVPKGQGDRFKQLRQTEDWIRMGSFGQKRRVIRAGAWEARAAGDEFAVDPTWTRAIAGGGHMQLVALGRPRFNPMIWWTPEGKPIAVSDRHLDPSISKEVSVALVRIWEDGKRRDPSAPPDRFVHGAGFQLVVVPADDPTPQGGGFLSLETGFGPYTDETTLEDEVGATATIGGIEVRVQHIFDHKSIHRTNTLLHWATGAGIDLTIVAVTTDGKRVESRSPPPLRQNRVPEIATAGDFFEHELARTEIDHYVIKSRPRQKIEFKGFALAPLGEEGGGPAIEFEPKTSSAPAVEPKSKTIKFTGPDYRLDTGFVPDAKLPRELPTVVWKFVSERKKTEDSKPQPLGSGDPIMADGVVYFGDDLGRLYAVNAETGAEIWRHEHGARIYKAIALDATHIYLGTKKGITAIRRYNGTLDWNHPIDHGADEGDPLPIGDAVYAAGYDGVIYALNRRDGSMIWKHDFVQDAPPNPPGGGARVRFDGSPARPGGAASDGETFVQCVFDQSRVFALDCATGKPRWSFQALGWMSAAPTIVGNRAYVASQDKHVYCLDLATGELVWKFKTPNWLSTRISVHAGRVFVPSSRGRLYQLSAETGTELHVFQSDEPEDRKAVAYCLPLVSDETVYFASGKGNFYALDIKSNHLLWKLCPSKDSELLTDPATDGSRIFLSCRPTQGDQGQTQQGESAIIAIGLKP